MPLPGFRDQTRLPDFEVRVRFISQDEGGRKTPADQGYRPDMTFAGEAHTWMINPEFLRDDGSSFALHEPVPQSVRANMYVIHEEARLLARDIVYVGRRVRMVEGSRPVALGEVTAIKNLPNELSEHEGSASAFAPSARAYIRWLNATTSNEVRAANMPELHELLARLQSAAALLPAVGPTSDDLPQKRDTAALEAVPSLGSKLPVKGYRFVFNPLNDKECDPVLTTLENDLKDIYKDLKDGLVLYGAGSYQDALWVWHSLYYWHWGRHLSHAQCAVWQYLSDGNWP